MGSLKEIMSLQNVHPCDSHSANSSIVRVEPMISGVRIVKLEEKVWVILDCKPTTFILFSNFPIEKTEELMAGSKQILHKKK